jgi:ribosomal protein L27
MREFLYVDDLADAVVFMMQNKTKEVLYNVGTGKDHTLFAKTNGIVRFREKNRTRFNGKTKKKKFVDVIPA